MTAPPLTIVAGAGRCGSSLVCQVLAAAGLPVAGRWPDYEDPRTFSHTLDLGDSTWLAGLPAGCVVKMLSPSYAKLPAALPCRWIICVRDVKQQARSMAKLLDLPRDKAHIARMAASIRRDIRHLDRQLRERNLGRRLRKEPAMYLRFEALIQRPEPQIQRLLDFVGPRPDAPPAQQLAEGVLKRAPHCLPGFLEAQLSSIDGPANA